MAGAISTGRGIRLALIALILAAAGCSPTTRGGTPAPTPSRTSVTPGPAVAAVPTCSQVEIQSAVNSFFVVWNQHDASAFALRFAVNGELDLTTKHEDTLTQGPAGYQAAQGREMIETLVSRQWSLGERLAYRGMTFFTNGAGALDGAEVNDVTATFPDHTTQRFAEAKFAYDCAQHAFSHVVIISAGVAS